MTKREFLDTVFALAPNEANKIMDAFDEYVERDDGMKWITLTKFTDRGKAYINASQICAVYEKYNDKNVTIIDFVGDEEKYLEVLESPEAVMNLIKGEVTTRSY